MSAEGVEKFDGKALYQKHNLLTGEVSFIEFEYAEKAEPYSLSYDLPSMDILITISIMGKNYTGYTVRVRNRFSKTDNTLVLIGRDDDNNEVMLNISDSYSHPLKITTFKTNADETITVLERLVRIFPYKIEYKIPEY